MLLTTIASVTGAPSVRRATPDDFATWAGEGKGFGRRALPLARTEAVALDGLRLVTMLALEVSDDFSDRLPGVR
jgi:hypothetical protein